MSFPRYPAYKDSGVEWLGEVPGHWQLPKLKHVARFSGGGTPSRDNLDFWGGDIPWVSPKNIKVELVGDAEERITRIGLENSTTNLIPPGYVLMVVRSGILKHTIPVAINTVEVALNQDMKALDFNGGRCDSRYFLRWVQGLNDVLLLEWAKQGATVESIEQTYLAESVVPLNKMKAWQGSLGISFHEGITSPDYIVYASIHKESNDFIHYMLRQRNLVGAYKAISNGIRPQQWRLEPGEFEALTFFLPPRAEQDKIASFIAKDARQLDALAAEAEQGISLLQERRTALVSAAVTGKIDVRGLAAEADLLEALAETRADLAAGRFVVESADAHMDRVEAELDGGT